MSCDSTKPLIIPAGSDSFSQIGERSTTLWPKAEMHFSGIQILLLCCVVRYIHRLPWPHDVDRIA